MSFKFTQINKDKINEMDHILDISGLLVNRIKKGGSGAIENI